MLNFREFCDLSDNVKSLNENAEWDNSYVEVGRKVINPYLNPTKFGKIDLIDGQTVKLGLSPYYDREGKKQYAKIIKIPIRPKKEKMREGLMGEIKTIRQFEEIQNTSKSIVHWLLESDVIERHMAPFIEKSLFSVFSSDNLNSEMIRGVVQRNIDENFVFSIEANKVTFNA